MLGGDLISMASCCCDQILFVMKSYGTAASYDAELFEVCGWSMHDVILISDLEGDWHCSLGLIPCD